MKKIAKILLVLSLSFVFLLGAKMDFYAASASLTGPTTVRAGDTITLKLSVSDSNKYLFEGTLSYDASVVSLSSVEAGIKGWEAEVGGGGALLIYDDAYATPLSGTKNIATFKFKVKENVPTGTLVRISINNSYATDGNNDSVFGTVSYSTKIAAPLSANANLSALSVAEGTLNPGFKAGTTTYNIGEVDYSVSKLNITYKTEDTKATVSINGNNLAVGANTVSVVVKAENGTTKTYKIQVTRKQDPNYVASSNAALGGITISGGAISPTFSSEVTDYIVYLPYEYVGKNFTVSGTASDEKALGVTSGIISSLVEGVNTTSVVCKAEDGTEKTYKITVVVMPQYNGAVPNIEGVEAPEVDTESTEFEQNTEDDLSGTTDKNNGGGIAGPIAIVVIIVLIGALIYVLFFLNKRNRL